MKHMESKKAYRSLAVYFVLISVLEILAYLKGSVFSVVASRVWLLSGGCIFLSFLYLAVRKVHLDIKEKRFVLVICFTVFFSLFCSCIGNIAISDINPDSAAQLTAGLNSFSMADLNYTGTGFLGYPNRQYVLAAIPSLLFGRNIFSFHLGFAWPFLIGLCALYFEYRAWLVEYAISEIYALLPIGTFLLFPFITEYYRNFEQAITPVALTMIGIALYLRLLRRQDILSLFALSWIGGLFCDSYTPVLASLGLLLVFLGLYCIGYWNSRSKVFDLKKYSFSRGACGALMVNLVMFFLATLLNREDRITQTREELWWIKEAVNSWIDFFTDKNARFLGLTAGIIVIYLLLSLLGRLRIHDFLIAGWVIGVVFAANYLTGYTSYEKAWILQRNMIVIPVLITAVFFVLLHFALDYKIIIKPVVTGIFYLFTLAVGVLHFMQPHQSFVYFQYVQPMKYLISYIGESLKESEMSVKDNFGLIVYTDNGLQTNIEDYAKYFFPNAICRSYGTAEVDETLEKVEGLPTFCFSETPIESEMVLEGGEHQGFYSPIYHMEIDWYRVYLNE